MYNKFTFYKDANNDVAWKQLSGVCEQSYPQNCGKKAGCFGEGRAPPAVTL